MMVSSYIRLEREKRWDIEQKIEDIDFMKAIYEMVENKNCAGIQFGFYTVAQKYEPPHWHEELEILYYLNGEASLITDGVSCRLPKKQAVVINPGQIHNTSCSEGGAMYLCVHIDLKFMEEYVPDIQTYRIECNPEKISDQDFPKYRKICELFEQITKYYMYDEEVLFLEVTGLILQIFALLLRNFSQKNVSEPLGKDVLTRKRIRKVLAYTQEHYMEQIPLEEIAALLGLGREYFCRFFKKNMGMSFGRYQNEVRISKIHHDLIHTDEPVSALMEKHGFFNSKLFYDLFREIYGCKPLQVRGGGEA